jgi:hypothetical protein
MTTISQQLTAPAIPVSHSNNAVAPSEGWGWFPILCLISALGVFLTALAYNEARLAIPGSTTLFWFGLLVVFVPTTLRLFSMKPSRRERIALLITLGVALYFVNFLAYPLYFASYDELGHWRTASDIVASGHLFVENPLLPISSLYPGMEIFTNAVSDLTGLPLFASGIIMLSVTHMVFVLALYLFYERFSKSEWLAGIATVLYISNAGYYGFDTSFSYESLALPIAIFVLSIVVLLYCTPMKRPKGLYVAILLGLGALVITHHVTTYALLSYLFLWAALSLFLHRGQKDWVIPGAIAVVGTILSVIWLALTGFVTVGYLAPHLGDTLTELLQIVHGQGLPRQLFHDSSGDVTPLWERIISFAAVALIGIGLLFGLYRLWRDRCRDAIILALACGAIAYPVSQVMRLTSAGGEAGYRAVEFLFLGVAFVLAIAITRFCLSRPSQWWRSFLMVAITTVIFLGQLISGVGPPWSLMPGPYLVSADQRSVEPEGITAAQWAEAYLGTGQRVATDRINTLLMATFGDEWVVTSGNATPVAPLFISLHFGPYVAQILQQDNIKYLVVDHRLSTGLPHVGTYFNIAPTGEVAYTQPISPEALTKFDSIKPLTRLFDSGNIVIYGAQALTNGPPITASTSVTSLLGGNSFPELAKSYWGTIYDIPTGVTTEMTFTNLQQNAGKVSGTLAGMPIVSGSSTLNSGLLKDGPLKGTWVNAKQVHFTVTNDKGRVTYEFNGTLTSDGSIVGSYCTPANTTGVCSDYGVWSISPSL